MKEAKISIFPRKSERSFKTVQEAPERLNKIVFSTVNTIRPATPDSLMRIQNISSRGISDRKLTPISAESTIHDLISICPSHQVSESRIKVRRKVTPKTKIIQKAITQEKVNTELSYRDFQQRHKELHLQRRSFLKKLSNKSKFESVQKIILRTKALEVEEEDDNFLKNTIYEKPALTYEEKLYRLQQVSIFK